MAFRALKLDLLWKADPAAKSAAPAVIRVEAEASEIHPETYPRRLVAKFDFPARGNLPPVKLTWYNGGPKPPKDVLLGHIMTEWGCLVKGTQGAIFTSCPWNTRLELLPKAKFQDFKGPSPTIARSPGHHAEWILGLQGRAEAFLQFRDRRPAWPRLSNWCTWLHWPASRSNTIRSAARSSTYPRRMRCCTANIVRAGCYSFRFTSFSFVLAVDRPFGVSLGRRVSG